MRGQTSRNGDHTRHFILREVLQFGYNKRRSYGRNISMQHIGTLLGATLLRRVGDAGSSLKMVNFYATNADVVATCTRFGTISFPEPSLPLSSGTGNDGLLVKAFWIAFSILIG